MKYVTLSESEALQAVWLAESYKRALGTITQEFLDSVDHEKTADRIITSAIATECILLAAWMHRAGGGTPESFIAMAQIANRCAAEKDREDQAHDHDDDDCANGSIGDQHPRAGGRA